MDFSRHLLFQDNPSPMLVFDRETLGFLAVNPAAVTKYGYSEDEFLAMTLRDIHPVEDLPRLLRHLDGKPKPARRAAVWRHCLKDGSVIQVSVTASNVTYRGRAARLVSAHDVTALVALEGENLGESAIVARHRREWQAEHARLRQRDVMLDSLQRIGNVGGWELELDTGVLRCSDQTCRIFGVAPAEMGDTLWALLDRVHPEDREAVGEAQARALTERGSFDLTHRIVRDDGSTAVIRQAAEVLQGERGLILCGVVHDITEQSSARMRMQEAVSLLRLGGTLARLGGWRVVKGEDRLVWAEPTRDMRDVVFHRHQTVAQALSLLVPEDRPRIRRLLQACLESGEGFDEVVRGSRDGGDVRWVRILGRAEKDGRSGVHTAVGAVQDVTEVVQAETERERLSRRLETVLDSISDGFVLVDREWRFQFLNRQAARLLRQDPAELVGRSIWDVYPQGVGTLFQQQYQQALDSGERRSFTGAYGDDTWFDVNVYPTSEGLAIYLTDVTDRKRAQEAVRINEERFRLVARATHDVVWDWDVVEDHWWCNDSLERRFGYQEPGAGVDGIGWWLERVHEEDRDRVRSRLERVLESDEEQWGDEYRLCRCDGEVAYVVDRGFVIRDGQGRVLRMLGSIIDVTERRQVEERLRQAQKLEAVGQLTGGVAHDFNNLLTVILGNGEMLAERLADDRVLGQLASMTVTAAEQGARLTNRLLAFARRQALDPRRVDVNDLIESMSELLRRTLGEDVEVGIVHGDGAWPALVDAGQLEAALLNLALNARDAMPDGGHLTIETGNVVLDDGYARQHDELEPGQYCVVSVTDDGEGMTGEVMSRAFDPFFTTKDVGKGSGLGLSMVYGFVRQSGGQVKIYSEPGLGTTVRLYLPRAGDGSTGAAPSAAGGEAVPGGDEHLLVVEDDELARHYLVSQLQSLGYRVSAAAHARQALELLNTIEPPDLLFTDVVMPGGMNGRELADRVQARLPRTRVLYTSGYAESAIVHQGRLEPGVQLLSKPYRRQELALKLRQVLNA